MRTGVAKIAARARLFAGAGGGLITISWDQFVDGWTLDPVTNQKIGTATRASKKINALIHYVGPATSGVRMFAEVKVGDAILDLDPETDLDGKENLTFEFGDDVWVQKKVPEELTKSWDAEFHGQKIMRSILVTKAQ